MMALTDDKPWHEQPWYRPVAVNEWGRPIKDAVREALFESVGGLAGEMLRAIDAERDAAAAMSQSRPPNRGEPCAVCQKDTGGELVKRPYGVAVLCEECGKKHDASMRSFKEADECTCHQCGGACKAEPTVDVKDIKDFDHEHCDICEAPMARDAMLLIDFYGPVGAAFMDKFVCEHCVNRIAHVAIDRAFGR